MNKRRVIGIIGTIVVCAGIALVGKMSGEEKKAVILDAQGETIATVVYQNEELFYVCEEGYESYVDLVCKEVTEIVKQEERLSEKDAQKHIVKEKMLIQTCFEKSIFRSLRYIYEKSSISNQRNFAVGITDTKGNLKACYSFSEEGIGRNNMVTSTYAGSTLKPISVYGPGIESGAIHWSSMYLDSPYTQHEDEEGNLSDWPVNTKPYTNELVTVEDALKVSNNAVAVKVLKDCGVEQACGYLEEQFEIDVEEEKRIMQLEGEDNILSNIALGYLKNGVTVPKMLAAYGVFANGGVYYPVRTVEAIEKENRSYYQRNEDGTQAFSSETAYIINRLLTHVVSEGGTAEDASVNGLDVCGKTGTSEKFLNNWFVGTTPEYVCAVWYEAEEESYLKNESVPIFREIIEEVPNDVNVKYPKTQHVKRAEYCKKTGMLAGEFCEEKAEGYYKENNIPAACTCR